MRGIFVYLYDNMASVAWKIFLLGFLVYFVFMVVSIARRAFSPKEEVPEEEIKGDVDEQW